MMPCLLRWFRKSLPGGLQKLGETVCQWRFGEAFDKQRST
jgi:hypothetical protein